ncbi:uncharacterized protein LOC105222956 [Bactrocera dorsalis]|uniref:Uncharacterized protein LOC105222956 n=1 Tax=Bactrocera dorsalis TaxID=27457 RepID=A0ABM3JR23_BACDO|nr:uncharacterized protein LOC105222956 [Bactrocera dorsalis]
MDYFIYDPKTDDFTNKSVIMTRSTNSKALLTQNSKQRIPAKKIRYFLWPFVLGVNLYDFLALCHLVPTHSLHLSRPFLMSTSPFQVFHKTQTQEYDLPMISN